MWYNVFYIANLLKIVEKSVDFAYLCINLTQYDNIRSTKEYKRTC